MCLKITWNNDKTTQRIRLTNGTEAIVGVEQCQEGAEIKIWLHPLPRLKQVREKAGIT